MYLLLIKLVFKKLLLYFVFPIFLIILSLKLMLSKKVNLGFFLKSIYPLRYYIILIGLIWALSSLVIIEFLYHIFSNNE